MSSERHTGIADPAAMIASLRVTAEASLAQTAGGRSLCGLQNDDRRSGAVKYEEGRVAALITLQRLLTQQSRAAAPLDPHAVLDQVVAEWQEELARTQRHATAATLWNAYRRGGVDALCAVREALAHDTAMP